ncbi:hypothetical protein SAMN02927924_04461 [Sphingobium faniae]|nr:hypothetical protein SAMN02927924_04461 [Sphingobium faniae]
MSLNINRRIVLSRHSKGNIGADIFCIKEEEIPSPKDNELLVRNHLVSMEPGLAGAITGDDYLVPSLQIGDGITGFTIGTVVKSRSPKFQEGSLVHVRGGWQDFAVVSAEPDVPEQMRPFAIDLERVPAAIWISLLSLSAFTAYIGMHVVAKAARGDVVVVSAAAGAVGSVAGQVALANGARVIGIAGGPRKCAYLLNELKFDAAIDYQAPDFVEQLDAACPNGIDVYFENVGGQVLEAVWPRMNTFGRMPLCGQIAQYGAPARPRGPNLFEATIKRLTLTGIMGLDAIHGPYFAQFQKEILAAYERGQMKQRVDIVDGLENGPKAWLGLFSGGNIGKRLLKISDIPN